jgi:uncharacterized protein YecE (DUF72 family)
MPKEISHQLRLLGAGEPLDAFFGQCRHLGEKLGVVLLQLPPGFELQRETVRWFLQCLRERYAGCVACEPRHPSWFAESADDLLREWGVARVAADPAIVPSAGVPGGDLRLAYFRLHGSPRMYYSHYEQPYLEQLADRIAQAAGAGAQVWCIFDNTAEAAAQPNAIALRQLLRARMPD